jgi:hypothetical protein
VGVWGLVEREMFFFFRLVSGCAGEAHESEGWGSVGRVGPKQKTKKFPCYTHITDQKNQFRVARQTTYASHERGRAQEGKKEKEFVVKKV